MGLGRAIFSALLAFVLVSSAHAAPRFIDNADQTVTDTQTGLMWTKNGLPAGTDLDYQDSLNFVAGMNTAHSFGHQDWRIPNIDELTSLIDHTRSYPALPAGNPFTSVQSSYYWSSTALPDEISVMHYEVDFGSGNRSLNHTWNNDLLWPVRGVFSPVSGSGTTLASGSTGSTYNATLTADWGNAPYSWTVTSGALPSGLSLNAGTGAITGTASRSGVFSFTVEIADSLGVKLTRSLSITINDLACANQPVRIGSVIPAFYPDFGGAYALAADNDTIQLRSLDFTSDLVLNRNQRVSLQGGYDCAYSVSTGVTEILGMLRVTGGTVKLASLRFK